jgi:AcrR family transcriptional regulator
LAVMKTTEQTGSTALADPSRSAKPADRLLAVATTLFAANGIRAIGVDRILREAGCAKASLYSTSGSKESLVVAYLTHLDLADRNRFEEAVEQLTDPVQKALTFFDLARAKGLRNEFPGCLYANAATEFPGLRFEPIDAHRRWVRSTLTQLIRSAGGASPALIARQVQLLYDGALTASKVEQSVEPIRLARRLATEAITKACAERA